MARFCAQFKQFADPGAKRMGPAYRRTAGELIGLAAAGGHQHDDGMRCQLAAICCAKGDVTGNLASHLRLMTDAASAGCDLAVFPEMSLTGSVNPLVSPGHLIPLDHPAVARLAGASGQAGVGVCFGLAERGPGGEAFITQVFAAEGRVCGVQRKRHLGEDEEEYTPAAESAVFEHGGVRFGIAICAESGFDAPFDTAASAGAHLVLFPAAPGLYGRRADEASWQQGFTWWEGSGLGDARRHARRRRLWIALAGQAGSTADEDFPGLAALVRPDGSVAARLPDWRPGVLTVEIPLGSGQRDLVLGHDDEGHRRVPGQADSDRTDDPVAGV